MTAIDVQALAPMFCRSVAAHNQRRGKGPPEQRDRAAIARAEAMFMLADDLDDAYLGSGIREDWAVLPACRNANRKVRVNDGEHHSSATQ